MALFVAGSVAALAFAHIYDPEPAKAVLLKEKRAVQAVRIKALREKMRQKRLQKVFKGPDIFGAGNSKVPQPPSKTPFKEAFNPSNLEKAGPDATKAAPEPSKAPQSPGKGTFGDVFNPGNLDKAGPKKSE